MAERLYKLREWLTVPDAAAHLSIAFGENVTEADVLRLGLDGHLTLSVNFVNHGSGRLGRVVPREQATVRTLKPSEPGRKPEQMPGDIFISKDRVLVFDHRETKIVSIDGIWDLPMCGAERIDVEHRHQVLSGGPEVTLIGPDGTFVSRPDGTWCQLQERVQRPQQRVIFGEGLVPVISGGVTLTTGESATLDTGEPSWWPASELPHDAVLVVRTSALDDLKARVSESSSRDGGKPAEALKSVREAEARAADRDLDAPRPTTTEPTVPPGRAERVGQPRRTNGPDVATNLRETVESVGRKVESDSAEPAQPSDAPSEIGTTQEPPHDLVPFDIAAQNLGTSGGRKKAVKAFLSSCTHTAKAPILKAHIWKAMGYSGPRMFQYWLAKSRRETVACSQKVRRILAMQIPDFLNLLRKRKLI